MIYLHNTINDQRKFLMIIDQCHYEMVEIIKNINIIENNHQLIHIQKTLKNIINESIDLINPLTYNENKHLLNYILTSFSDNLFFLYGPNNSYNIWQDNTMEKNYFNTITSSYIFTQNISKIIDSNQTMDPIFVYSYYLFFESLPQGSSMYFIELKKFFQENMVHVNLNNNSLPKPHLVYEDDYYLSTNFFNYLILLWILWLIIQGNHQWYWYWIVNSLPVI